MALTYIRSLIAIFHVPLNFDTTLKTSPLAVSAVETIRSTALRADLACLLIVSSMSNKILVWL